jgi:uncharacterized repeat protein (TIGR01451 family)
VENDEMKVQFRGRQWGAAIILSAVAVTMVFGAEALAQRAGGQPTTVSRTVFPAGSGSAGVIAVERSAPMEVRVGAGMIYELKLVNLTAGRVEGVTLTEQFPADFTVNSLAPEPDRRLDNRATWILGELGPRASKVIRVTGVPTRTGELPSCATATFTTKACSTFRVVEPRLELVKTAPAEVMLCDPIPITLRVANRGTGVAQNVRIIDQLPQGWKTLDGRSEVTIPVGDLGAGQARETTIQARAGQVGQFVNEAAAQEDGGLTAAARATTRVVRPVLALSKTGPSMRYLGRPASFQLTLQNNGDAPAANTMLVDTLPMGMSFVSASDGGRLASGQVTWGLGTIAPGDTRTVSVTVTPTKLGRFRNTATAQARCAEAAASAELKVRGVPAILLEVVDRDDPIEVGANERYEIRVLNQGSAEGTNIVIACELPPEQEFVSADGPTRATRDGKRVVFAPLRSLGPRAEATYQVIVKGVQVGDTRFKVTLTSDQLQRPVEETESTHIY